MRPACVRRTVASSPRDESVRSAGQIDAPLSHNSLALALALALGGPALADKVRIIEDPREASQIRVDLIQQAKHSIDGQYYIVGDDYFTYAGLALLRDAARRGCKVRVIIDGRSNKISPAVHAHLRAEGISIKLYHPITLRRPSWAVRRMHDKGLDVDGKRMIRGGRNVEGDYFGYAKRNFIDRDVYVDGKAVAESDAYFDELWNSDEVVPVKTKDPTGARGREGRRVLDSARAKLGASKAPRINTETNWSARAREVGPVQFFHDPVGRKGLEAGISTSLVEALRGSHRSILIETPYLVPTKELLKEIERVKKQGVTKIEMITNSLSSNDSMLVQLGYETSKKKLAPSRGRSLGIQRAGYVAREIRRARRPRRAHRIIQHRSTLAASEYGNSRRD